MPASDPILSIRPPGVFGKSEMECSRRIVFDRTGVADVRQYEWFGAMSENEEMYDRVIFAVILIFV